MAKPEWTTVRPSLNQKSVIDSQLMKESCVVQVDSTDTGASDTVTKHIINYSWG